MGSCGIDDFWTTDQCRINLAQEFVERRTGANNSWVLVGNSVVAVSVNYYRKKTGEGREYKNKWIE